MLRIAEASCRRHPQGGRQPDCRSMRTSRLLAAAWGPAALVVGAVALAVATRASATAVVKIDASEPLSEVGELFMGMTTDWWLDFPDAP